MPSDQPLLSVKNLTVKFGESAVVNDISFDITHGETLALVGESGSGKTMTALAITQLLPLAAKLDKKSCVYLQGEDLFLKSELMMQKIRGSRIGMIFQEAITALNPVLTVGHQIDEVLKAHTNNHSQARVIECLDEVGIMDPAQCITSYPHQLSGGMKQRALIAIALAAEPELLIADEPTTALDVTIQAQVLELLQKVQKKRGMSVLFITHDLGIVKQIADHVAESGAGLVLMHMQGSPSDMQNDPEYEDVVREIIGYLRQRIDWAVGKGIDENQIVIDPGIGFGKSVHHNLEIFRRMNEFSSLRRPLLVGPSRKSFLRLVLEDDLDQPVPADSSSALFGTTAAVAASVLRGASIIRAHDVREMREVIAVARKMI